MLSAVSFDLLVPDGFLDKNWRFGEKSVSQQMLMFFLSTLAAATVSGV